MKYFGIICLVFNVGCAEKKIHSEITIANCRAVGSLAEIQKEHICPFFEDYREALNTKKVDKLLPYIGEHYRGSDGMNAKSIRAAMANEIQNMPWSDAQFIEFQVAHLSDRIEIVHRMQVKISTGEKKYIREKLHWSLDSNRKWRIVNWQHKV